MITNTCLTGGSLETAPPALDPEDPDAEDPDPADSDDEDSPSPPPAELAGVVAAPDEPFAVVGFDEPAALGVGVSSEDAGSLEEDDEGGDAGAVAVVLGGAGTIVVAGLADAASVAVTGELATSPRSTPKPRNTSTTIAEIRGAGRVRPVAGGSGGLVDGAPTGGTGAACP